MEKTKKQFHFFYVVAYLGPQTALAALNRYKERIKYGFLVATRKGHKMVKGQERRFMAIIFHHMNFEPISPSHKTKFNIKTSSYL